MSKKGAKNHVDNEAVAGDATVIQDSSARKATDENDVGQIAKGADDRSSVNAGVALDPDPSAEGNVVSFPEPMTEQVVNLTADPNGPKMRLLRSHRYRQVRIQADEKPEAIHLAAFREAGFRWRPDEKAWTKQLERDAEWRTALDAERLFYAVANAIRSDNGLEPVRELGR